MDKQYYSEESFFMQQRFPEVVKMNLMELCMIWNTENFKIVQFMTKKGHVSESYTFPVYTENIIRLCTADLCPIQWD